MYQIDPMSLTLLSLICIFPIAVLSQGGVDPNLSLNPCSQLPSLVKCEGGDVGVHYFYNKTNHSCSDVEINECSDLPVGFPDLDSCQTECIKRRSVRRLPAETKYEILEDIEMSVPTKLSKSVRRKFPLNFCSLQWDSGLICPGFHRGDYIDQFFYDDKTNTCNHFVYNGCGGNANRFPTTWQCIQSCVRKSNHRKKY